MGETAVKGCFAQHGHLWRGLLAYGYETPNLRLNHRATVACGHRCGPSTVCEVTGVVYCELQGTLWALRGTAPSGPRSDPEFAVRTGVTILHLVQLEGGLNLST